METVTTNTRKTVYSGVLSALVLSAGAAVATLSREIRGVPTDAQITVPAEAMPSVESLLVEGQTVSFYGQPTETGFTVIGPDLRRSTLAKAGETAPVAKAAKPKRVMSEKQRIAWETIIKPSYDAGRARKRAEREAAAAASETVAA